jgi:hypothetical protein
MNQLLNGPTAAPRLIDHPADRTGDHPPLPCDRLRRDASRRARRWPAGVVWAVGAKVCPVRTCSSIMPVTEQVNGHL